MCSVTEQVRCEKSDSGGTEKHVSTWIEQYVPGLVGQKAIAGGVGKEASTVSTCQLYTVITCTQVI